MRKAEWYFDFISPFAYIALQRLDELPADVDLRLKPVLFAGLLDHWGQKGPAELEPKRVWTYRWCTWWAAQQGVPFHFPATHPFNSLPYLRAALAAGCTRAAVGQIFKALWSTGADAGDPATLRSVLEQLGLQQAALASQPVKDALRANTAEAAARGVFGVPTLAVSEDLFWGADGFDFALACLADPALLQSAEMLRLASLPVGASRRR